MKDTHIVVTGGASRIGLAFTEALLKKGARVTFTFKESIKSAGALMKKYETAHGIQLDLTDLSSIEKACTSLLERFGSPSVLINNASVFFSKPLGEVSELDWDLLHATNVKGHFFFIQALLPYLKEGLILNIADTHATVPLRNYSAYVTQKAAFRMLTKNLALELAPSVRVNSISPGSILFPERFTEGQKARHLQSCPLGRAGSPPDLIEAALFLIENDYVTGFDLKVDGGSSLSSIHRT